MGFLSHGLLQGLVALHFPVLVECRLQPTPGDAVEDVLPATMHGLAGRLGLDLTAGDGLIAVDALAEAAGNRALLVALREFGRVTHAWGPSGSWITSACASGLDRCR